MDQFHLIIVTGMSGAGKSQAVKVFEDIGYFCIDNLPIQLLDKLIDFSNTFHSDVSKVAVGIDVRNGSGIDEIPQTLEQLRQKNFPYEHFWKYFQRFRETAYVSHSG